MAVIIVFAIAIAVIFWLGSQEENKRTTIREAMEDQLMESPRMNLLVNQTETLVREQIQTATKYGELVGTERHLLAIMLSKYGVYVSSKVNEREYPLHKSSTDGMHNLFCAQWFGHNVLNNSRSRVRFEDCGFDTISPGEMEATKNVLKKKLMERNPELWYYHEFKEDDRNPVLVFDLTHLHPHRNMKTLLS